MNWNASEHCPTKRAGLVQWQARRALALAFADRLSIVQLHVARLAIDNGCIGERCPYEIAGNPARALHDFLDARRGRERSREVKELLGRVILRELQAHGMSSFNLGDRKPAQIRQSQSVLIRPRSLLPVDNTEDATHFAADVYELFRDARACIGRWNEVGYPWVGAAIANLQNAVHRAHQFGNGRAHRRPIDGVVVLVVVLSVLGIGVEQMRGQPTNRVDHRDKADWYGEQMVCQPSYRGKRFLLRLIEWSLHAQRIPIAFPSRFRALVNVSGTPQSGTAAP